MASPEDSLTIPALRKLTLWRGLRLCCPQCGERGLFRRYARLHMACPTCDLVLRREQGAQTGSMYLTGAVCQIFAMTVVWLGWFFTDWSSLTFVCVAAPLVLLFCVLFVPFSQTIWIAVEYLTDAVNDEDWVHPRI